MTYWETRNLIRCLSLSRKVYCSCCNQLAVQTEAYDDENHMVLDKEGYPAYFCEAHKYGRGTEIYYDLPHQPQLIGR